MAFPLCCRHQTLIRFCAHHTDSVTFMGHNSHGKMWYSNNKGASRSRRASQAAESILLEPPPTVRNTPAISQVVSSSDRPMSNINNHNGGGSVGSDSNNISKGINPLSTPQPLAMTDLGFLQGKKRYRWRQSSKRPGAAYPMSSYDGSLRTRVLLFGMPQGYPDSCAAGFRRYFVLSLTSSFASSFASSIGYQSILNGFFLGSSPQLWMLKDLLPALAAAYLANRIISYENRPKFWFVVSVVMHNLSVIAEMIVPWALPQHLLVGAIVTSCVRQSASLMFLVTRASALQHFAVTNNLAELTKKFNSFSMVIYTVATAIGIAYTSIVTTLPAQLVTVVVCCAANMLISYLSMNKIAFRVLNATTISVILRDYAGKNGEHLRRAPTPEHVSNRIGLAMVDKLTRDRHDRTCLLYVSPPIEKLRIFSDRLEQDVLYACASGSFALALWEPIAPLSLRHSWARWELPRGWSQLRLRFSPAAAAKESMLREKFRQRLVLLVHHECDQLHLLTAYLLAYTALLHHAESIAELRDFLRSCNTAQSAWLRHGAEFVESLRRAGWDTEQLALDHPDFRLSSLRFAAVSQGCGNRVV